MTASIMAAKAKTLRLSGLIPESIVDGPGLRMTIFTQGCPHHCAGCQNPETHAESGGQEYSLAEIISRYQENPLLSGITFSGGEPFLQAGPLSRLGAQILQLGGDIVTYTGYTLEQLLKLARRSADISALLGATDLLVDGPFILAQASLELPFRGSANQRLIPRREFINFLP